MNTEKQKELLDSKIKILNEIEYRESVLKGLVIDSKRGKGFVSNFLRKFLKHDEKAPGIYWKDGETIGRYPIDADKELHKDIALALEKSIERLRCDYKQQINN